MLAMEEDAEENEGSICQVLQSLYIFCLRRLDGQEREGHCRKSHGRSPEILGSSNSGWSFDDFQLREMEPAPAGTVDWHKEEWGWSETPTTPATRRLIDFSLFIVFCPHHWPCISRGLCFFHPIPVYLGPCDMMFIWSSGKPRSSQALLLLSTLSKRCFLEELRCLGPVCYIHRWSISIWKPPGVILFFPGDMPLK